MREWLRCFFILKKLEQALDGGRKVIYNKINL